MRLRFDCNCLSFVWRRGSTVKVPLADSDRKLMTTTADDNDGQRSYGNTVQNATAAVTFASSRCRKYGYYYYYC